MIIPKPAELKDFSTFEDSALLKLIAAQQPEAMEVLYKRYGNSVFEGALEACGQSELAEEVTLDVYLYVWENARGTSPENKSTGDWLLEIGRGIASKTLGQGDNVRVEKDAYACGGEDKPCLVDAGMQDGSAASPAELPGGLKRRLMHIVKKRKAALLGAKQNAASG